MRGQSQPGRASAVTGAARAFGVAACGSSAAARAARPGDDEHARARSKPRAEPAVRPEPHRRQEEGRHADRLSNEDFQHLDPGEAYFALDYDDHLRDPDGRCSSTRRTTRRPDLATAIPTAANGGITDGGKTVTVHIQTGVHFSPPVNRAVTSADVAYAIERGANPNVGNAYFPPYFGADHRSVVGPQRRQGRPDPRHPDAEQRRRSCST